MSIVMPAIAETPPTRAAPASAAELAAGSQVPVQLPIRYHDGEPIRHLSAVELQPLGHLQESFVPAPGCAESCG